MIIKTVVMVSALVLTSPMLQAKEFIGEYTYSAGDADSKLSSRKRAIEEVKRQLLNEIGTHINSEVNIRSNTIKTYADSDIQTLTAGFLKLKIIDESWDGFSFYVRAVINADPDDVLKRLDALVKDSSKAEKVLTKLKRLNVNYENAVKDIEKLKSELIFAKDNETKYKNLLKRLRKASKALPSSSTISVVNYKSLKNIKNIAYGCTFPSEGDIAAPDWLCGMPLKGVSISTVGASDYRKSKVPFEANLSLKYNTLNSLRNILSFKVKNVFKVLVYQKGKIGVERFDQMANTVLREFSNILYMQLLSKNKIKVFASVVGPKNNVYSNAGVLDKDLIEEMRLIDDYFYASKPGWIKMNVSPHLNIAQI